MAFMLFVGDEDGNVLGDPVDLDALDLSTAADRMEMVNQVVDRINRFSKAKKVKQIKRKPLNILPRKSTDD